MTVPGSPSNLAPPGPADLPRRVETLERQLRELRASMSLAASTISQGGLKVATGGVIQSTDFDGALPSTAGTTGWALGGAGSNAIFNNIVLRGGIIGNDALANPIVPARGHIDASGFSLTTAAAIKANITFTVPTGFTQAVVFATTVANARNKNTVQDFLGGYVTINNATPGLDAAQDGAPGYSVEITNAASAVLTGLSGTFFVRTLLYSGTANWAADTFNRLNLDVIVLYLR